MMVRRPGYREHNGGKTSRDGLAKPGALARTLLRR